MDAEGLRFNSQAGQIGHTIANGSPPLRRFFGAALPGAHPRNRAHHSLPRFDTTASVL